MLKSTPWLEMEPDLKNIFYGSKIKEECPLPVGTKNVMAITGAGVADTGVVCDGQRTVGRTDMTCHSSQQAGNDQPSLWRRHAWSTCSLQAHFLFESSIWWLYLWKPVARLVVCVEIHLVTARGLAHFCNQRHFDWHTLHAEIDYEISFARSSAVRDILCHFCTFVLFPTHL